MFTHQKCMMLNGVSTNVADGLAMFFV